MHHLRVLVEDGKILCSRTLEESYLVACSWRERTPLKTKRTSKTICSGQLAWPFEEPTSAWRSSELRTYRRVSLASSLGWRPTTEVGSGAPGLGKKLLDSGRAQCLHRWKTSICLVSHHANLPGTVPVSAPTVPHPGRPLHPWPNGAMDHSRCGHVFIFPRETGWPLPGFSQWLSCTGPTLWTHKCWGNYAEYFRAVGVNPGCTLEPPGDL